MTMKNDYENYSEKVRHLRKASAIHRAAQNI